MGYFCELCKLHLFCFQFQQFILNLWWIVHESTTIRSTKICTNLSRMIHWNSSPEYQSKYDWYDYMLAKTGHVCAWSNQLQTSLSANACFICQPCTTCHETSLIETSFWWNLVYDCRHNVITLPRCNTELHQLIILLQYRSTKLKCV